MWLRLSEKRRDQEEDWIAEVRAKEVKERRLRWLGHVLRMEDSRIPRQTIQWELRGYTRGSWDGQGKTGWTLSDEI